MGITVNTIPNSTVLYGTPAPDNDYCSRGSAGWLAVGKDSFDLAMFPKGELPSGGASCRISSSEMVQLWVQMKDYQPRNDSGIYTLYRMNDLGQFSMIGSKIVTSDFQEDPSWTWYYSYDFVFFGYFDWEINSAGKYAIEAVYPQGTVRWEFEVYDTRPPALQPPALPIPPPPAQPPVQGTCTREGKHIGEEPGRIGDCCQGLVREWDPAWAIDRCISPAAIPPDLGQPPAAPPNIGCPDGTTGIWPVCIPLPGQPGLPPAPELPPDLGQPPPDASPCPRGQTYPAEWKDTILGCDQGYQRPLFGDFCECTHGKNADIIDKLGMTNTLVIAAVGLLVFLGLVKR